MKHDRNVRSVVAVLMGMFFASSADFAVMTVLGLQVYDLTHRDFDLGLLGLMEFAPSAFLVLDTGSVADRFPRQRVAATALAFEALVVGLLGWYAGVARQSVWAIFALVILFGATRAFISPAQRALPADTVLPVRVPWLVARNSVAMQAGIIVGPVLGGLLYGHDPSLPYFGVTVLLVISAIAVLGARPHAQITGTVTEAAVTERGGLHAAFDGFRFVRWHPVLLGAISLDLFAVLFGGATALLPALARDRLHVGPLGLGWLRAAGGIGAGFVALTLAWRPVGRHVGRVLLGAVAIFGVFTIALGVTRSFAVAFIAMGVLSGADAISMFIRGTLGPLVTPRDKRGHVLALENIFIGASNELGAFESGMAGQLLGSSGAIVLGGVATIVVALTWAMCFPSLRDVNEFPVAT